MTIDLTSHNPKGSGIGKEQLPPIPAGAPLIGQLASYTNILSFNHYDVAMKCRVCGYVLAGSTLFVHSAMRGHHEQLHPRPVEAVPVPTPVPRVEKPRPGRPLTASRQERRDNLTPCTGIIARTTRKGEQCGKPSIGGRCGRHPASGVVTVAGSCTPCPVTITRGPRRGEACGRATPGSACDNHAREARG